MRQIILIITIFISNFLNGQDNRWIEPSSIDTTVTFSNLTLDLKPTQTKDFDQYYLSNKLIDSLTKEHGNFYNKSLAVEKYLMQKFGSRVKRNDRDLSIKLDNENWMLMEINPEYDETGHTFEFYFNKFGFYSIRVQWGEGNGYKLVNSKNGEVTDIIGRPYFSLDGTKIIALGNDIEAGYSINGFQLLSNNSGTITELGRFSPSAWGCESAKWLTNDKLILKNESIEFQNSKMNYFNFYTELEIR